MRRVEVEWLDSVGGEGWEHPDAARRTAAEETMRCWSSGYILTETAEYLLLCMSWMENGGSVHAPLQIPKVGVLAIHDLKENPPARPRGEPQPYYRPKRTGVRR